MAVVDNGVCTRYEGNIFMNEMIDLSINRIYYSDQMLSENSHQHFLLNMMLFLL
jgi:hypothetical protein